MFDEIIPRFRIVIGEIRRIAAFRVEPDLDFFERIIRKKRPGSATATLERLIADSREISKGLLRPAAVYGIFDGRTFNMGVYPEPEFVGIAVVTIGSDLEHEAGCRTSAGDITMAMLLDAWGSAWVEGAVGAVDEVIRKESDLLLCQAGKRRSPGFSRWPIREQREIFDRLAVRRMGIELTDASTMIPAKSVSFGIPMNRSENPLNLQ